MIPIKAYHNSRLAAFRSPFGAVTCLQSVSLSLMVASPPGAYTEVFLRIWSDGEERLFPMTPCEIPQMLFYGEHDTNWSFKEPQNAAGVLYRCLYHAPAEPGLVWYTFVIRSGGSEYRYGLDSGSGGEGMLNPHEFHSYQLTVYAPTVVPEWYRHAVVYQIFPDRFHRGKDWLQRAVKARSEHRTNGIKRVLQLDWDDTPYYEKDADSHIRRWPFFGGTLMGITEKLPYLEELGITALYLNPIFEAASNHKYDTGDFLKIDPGFGDEADFTELCRLAEQRGISIILDGVFNHTGCNSLYFNKYQDYPTIGAYQSEKSPYYAWYQFSKFPDEYDCWWGVKDLPAVNERVSSYQEFIYQGADAVARHWIRAGAKGWRLDVADELPDDFIVGIRHAIKEEDSEALLLGEVWEDASHKVSYGQMRRYLLGNELDSTTNYPFLTCMIDYLLGKNTPAAVHETMISLCENYPPQNFYATLNLIGSHDRCRILTVLGEGDTEGLDAWQRERYHLPKERRALAIRRLKLLSLTQMTFPGVPCIYYGDEAGAEGFEDPYNRGAFPWGREEGDLTEWYRRMIKLRREYSFLVDGTFQSYGLGDRVYGYARQWNTEQIILLLNASNTSETVELTLNEGQNLLLDLLSGGVAHDAEETIHSIPVEVPPISARLLFARCVTPAVLMRSAGIVCHITSLPSRWGIGDLGQCARAFVDFLQSAGQKIWQILPLNPPGPGNSPYSSDSLFAGSALLLSIEKLVQNGLLDEKTAEASMPMLEHVGMYEAAQSKLPLLKEAYTRFDASDPDYIAFVSKNADWLEDDCLYRALKEKFNGLPWQEWPESLRRRQPEALDAYRNALTHEQEFYAFVQYEFDRQWAELRRYAADRGVKIMGDLPFYAAMDSSDVWANQPLFSLDDAGRTKLTGGVPPDYFSPEGQNWENPVYRWESARDGCYDFWLRRVKQAFEKFDLLRLDHFRGFEAFYQIPAGSKTAASGRWVKGPGRGLFERLYQLPQFGNLIAEDLGMLTPEVDVLKCSYMLPGMKVYQFSADEMVWDGAPLRCAYYSGTHDNDTLAGFVKQAEGLDGIALEQRCAEIIARLYQSPAVYAMTPLQDVLFLDSSHRMNTPGSREGNWVWRVPQELPLTHTAAWLKELAERSGRSSPV